MILFHPLWRTKLTAVVAAVTTVKAARCDGKEIHFVFFPLSNLP
jgi:hypothetical protein